MILIILIPLLAVAVLIPLRAELRRLDALRRRREWLRANPHADQLRRAMRQFAVGLTPALGRMVRAAADMEAQLAKVAEAMRGVGR